MNKTIFMRFPQGKAKAVTFSYDDGILQDLRLVSIFDKYQIKGTFNFTNYSPIFKECSDEQIRDTFLSKGHEIAVHGAFHKANGIHRPIEGISDVLNCRLLLEEKWNCIIRGMAYPDSGIRIINSGTSYETIRSYLKQLDIAYARTLGGTTYSYELPDDWYAWMPTMHHDDPEIMERIEEFLALDISPQAYCRGRRSRLLYIWGHSYEFDRNDNWEHIEKICEKLSGNNELWFATNIEIYNYIQAYDRLQYSANGTLIYNPTLIPIWLDIDGEISCISPGETLSIS